MQSGVLPFCKIPLKTPLTLFQTCLTLFFQNTLSIGLIVLSLIFPMFAVICICILMKIYHLRIIIIPFICIMRMYNNKVMQHIVPK